VPSAQAGAPQVSPTPADHPPETPAQPAAAPARPARDTSPRLLPGVVVSREELYSEDAVEIAAAAGGLLRAGIDARHLRAWRTSVEREVGLYEQLVMPILRQRNPEARSLASAQLRELNDLGAKLRNALVNATERDQLDL
jgi:hypothetical protein